MNFTEIKIKSESLIAARLNHLEELDSTMCDESAYLDCIYSNSEHHTKTDMLKFFRSFDSHKENAADVMEFNERCGFTSQYKDLMK